jgi:membrane protein DedA with SNARE-associated domain
MPEGVSDVERRSRIGRVPLLWLAAARAVLGIVAIPLAPALYRDHFVVLVLLRPSKEVLLAAGFLIRDGRVHLFPVLLASIPLAILGVWHFYVLGQAWAKEINDDELPRFARRVLPSKRIKALTKVLEKKGVPVVLFGRLAVFPSTLIAAAAGASRMEPRRFFLADGLGGLLSVAEVLIAGYLFGAAYKSAGKGITVIGIIVFVGLLIAFGRWLSRET